MSGFEFTTVEKVTDDFVSGLLCTAFEGGSNYWYQSLRVGSLPEGTVMKDFHCGGRMQAPGNYFHWSQLVPVKGGTVLLDDAEEEDDDGNATVYELGKEQLSRGLQIMRERHPRHWQDAVTGDVFLQCCLFGDVIYG